jgi:dTDP-4-amino-4,6-dideoxygalactose transaminase
MAERVYLSAPDVGAVEESYVLAALRSGWVAPLGPDVDAFERDIATRVDVPYAVALNSGTAALHLALLSLGVGAGDLVVVPTLTFAATANAVRYTGAEPVFVDCEPDAGNLDVGLLADVLSRHRDRQRPIRAVLTVDMFGHCADYDAILAVCAAHDVPVVEDAAEALGSSYRGRAAGSFGRAAALSFNGNKIMTTSGGGMLLTHDAALADRTRYLATQARQPVAHYEHTEVGYNYRLSNLLAALGRAQLTRLDEMIARRRSIRDRYAKAFAGTTGIRLLGDGDVDANCWLTTIVVDPELTGWHARDLGDHLAARNVESRPVWKPMHLQPVFAGAPGMITGQAERLFENGLVLPSGSALGEAQRARVFDALAEFLAAGR